MKRNIRIHCGQQNCHAITIYEVDNLKEQSRILREEGHGKWKCIKHSDLEELLNLNRLQTTKIFKAIQSPRHPDLTQLFWNGSFGLQFGPGFKAFANDFPPGTILKITAEIILPKES